MKFLARLLLLLVVVGFGAVYYFGFVPYGPSTETFVDIPTGAGSAGVAARLEQAGVIRSRYAFLAMRKVHGGTLHAGEYRFDHPLPLGEVYGKIIKGEVYTRTLVIPEGYNIFDIAQAVGRAGLGDPARFLAAERQNVSLIGDLNPGAVSLEGFLFPDTYRFSPHATPEQMLAAMVKRFRQVAVQLGLIAPPGSIGDASVYPLAQVITMASLVEKEVHVDAERPVVAGVFENRMTAGMPLATDPTVIYAALLDGRWRGTIYQSDLQSESPYNTYKRTGLPPGPIANPGVAALKAAMHPAKTDYLYFVADANGNTRFSKDLKEHAEQVQEYRKAVRQ